MPIAAPSQNSFIGGEFSPLSYGRIKYPKYEAGMSLMQRYLSLVQGPTTRTPGTIYVRDTKADQQVRIMPFVFNNGDAYIIEFGNDYCRFFANRNFVTNAAVTITGISQANPAVLTYSGTDPTNGQEAWVTGVGGMTQANNRWYVVTNVNTSTKTFQLYTLDGNAVDSSAYTAYTTGGTFATMYEIVSPYPGADVNDIRFYDSGDVIYLAHPSHAPNSLNTAGPTSWSFVPLVFTDGPYMQLNSTTTLMALSSVVNGATVTVNVNSTTGINSNAGFASTDVGRFIRWQNVDQSWWWLNITGYNSPTQVTALVGGVLAATSSIAVLGITNANPGVVSVTTPNPVVTGQSILLQGVGGMTQVNGNFYTAGTVSGGNIPIGVDTTGFGTYTSGGTVTSAGNKITAITKANPCGITFGTIPANFSVGLQICVTGVLGMTQINNLFGTITAITGNSILVSINSTGFSSYTGGGIATPALATWRVGEWSATTGYPSLVTAFEDRIVWAASPIAPTTINMSNTGDYLNMAPTSIANVVAASNAVQLTLNGTTQDPIRWIHSDELGLLIGTKAAEWVCLSDITGAALSPVNLPSARESTEYGSASSTEPVRIGKYLLFMQNSRRKIREMVYAFQFNSFLAPDITVPSEHLTESGLQDMCYQQEPFSLLWCLRTDGQVVAYTYNKDQDCVAGAHQTLGGFSDVGQTLPAIVESICAIPSPDGAQDDFWISVQVYVNGKARRFICYLSELTTNLVDVKNSVFLDNASVGVNSPASNVITGQHHLEGQVVGALMDGAPCPQQTVTNGTITVPFTGSNYVVGHPYLSQLKTLRPEAGSATGTAQGKIKRIHKLFLDLYQTVGIDVGQDFDHLQAQSFRTNDDNIGMAVPLYSGIKQCDYESDYDTDGYICIQNSQPLPCTIRAILPQLHTEDAQ
jgi:hypothetical protein